MLDEELDVEERYATQLNQDPPEWWHEYHATYDAQIADNVPGPTTKKPEPVVKWLGTFEQNAKGVLFRTVEDKDPETKALRKRRVPIAGPVQVVAMTCGPNGQPCIRLTWRDLMNRERTADAPLSALSSSRSNYLHDTLIGHGLRVAPGQEKVFLDALRSVQVRRVIRSVETPGWLDLNTDKPFYVTPSGVVIGAVEGEVSLSAPLATPGLHVPVGSLALWNGAQGKYAQGNSRMVFFIAAALAGPLLHITAEQSGAFSIVGLSGDGKSTALRLAGSVWGGPAHVGTFRSTLNGMESALAQASDSVLIVDEMGQANPKEIASIVYLVANETGAKRMTRTLDAAFIRTWRTLMLSAGEVTLEDVMRKEKQDFKGGLETRFLTIPSDAGKGHRVYETLHDQRDDNALSVMLARACGSAGGHVGPMFLTKLVETIQTDRAAFLRKASRVREAFIVKHAGADAAGPVKRAASKFALVAFAGELGIEYGALLWPAGECEQAAGICFTAWLGARGTAGDIDEHTAANTLRSYLSSHGLSRFPSITDDGRGQHFERVPEHGGFRRTRADGMDYLILPAAWKAILRGLGPNKLGQTLSKLGQYARERFTIPGMPQISYHVIDGKFMDAA